MARPTDKKSEHERVMLGFAALREAISTTALSHPPNHQCTVCHAAAGDKQALARILEEILTQELDRRR